MEIIIQLVLATLLGALIGFEREKRGKEAGLRTFSLVCLGACLLTITSFELFDVFYQKPGVSFDPSRVIQAIALGVSFIGAGVIFHQREGVVGLTTAAALWVAASIGLAIGAKLYFLAVLAAFLSLLILAILGRFEENIFKK